MVIVDVRPTGGRGDTGIPTDAYFAVEEIRDVREHLSFYLRIDNRLTRTLSIGRHRDPEDLHACPVAHPSRGGRGDWC